MKLEELKLLYNFMKDNFVIQAKCEDIELVLHPSAFSYSDRTDEETSTEDTKDYENFLFKDTKRKMEEEM